MGFHTDGGYDERYYFKDNDMYVHLRGSRNVWCRDRHALVEHGRLSYVCDWRLYGPESGKKSKEHLGITREKKMNNLTFAALVRELSAYYERRNLPSADTMELWMQRVKNIPEEAVSWIIRKIEEDSESFPRNLPAQIWAYYHEWLNTFPEKRAAHSYEVENDCKYCDGTGILIAYRTKVSGEKEICYSYLFRCGHCSRAMIEAWPIRTITELQEDGFHFREMAWPSQKQKTERNVEKLIRSVLKA